MLKSTVATYALSIILLGAGCSSGPTDDAGDGGASDGGGSDLSNQTDCTICPFDYANFTPATEEVSLSATLVPIVNRSCTFSSCHGDTRRPAAKLYLGPKKGEGEAWTAEERDTLVQNLVNAPSEITSEMMLVKAARPEESWLMHKLDGCQESAGVSDCSSPSQAGPCGDSMPERSPLLSCSERTAFRNWIAQGAKSN